MRTGIALGSNLGDRMANLRFARQAVVGLREAASPLISAPVFESAAVDCEPGAPPFLNTVVEISYPGHPMTLLDALRGIEVELGRPSKHPRNAARTMDLDILYVGNLVLRNEEIAIPHPRLHLRRFVLAPLAAIRPELVLPGQVKSISDLLASLSEGQETAMFAETW